MKRFFSALVACLVTMFMTVPALAAPQEFDPSTGGSIEITGTVQDKVYKLYRIFDMRVIDSQGTNTVGDTFFYEMNADFEDYFANLAPPVTTDQAAVAYVTEIGEDGADAISEFTEDVKAYILDKEKNGTLTQSLVSGTATGTVLTISGIPLGYYLLYPEGSASGICSLNMTKPSISIPLKADYPTIDKVMKVGAEEKTSWTYGTNEVIHFELTSKVPDMVGYNKYFYVVNDTMTEGLTFNDDLSVKINNVSLTGGGVDYTLNVTNGVSDTQLKIVFTNFIQYLAQTGDEILIEYSATLNEDASVDSDNPDTNTANVNYSNDPTHTYTGTDTPDPGDPNVTTPDVVNTIRTIQMEVLKVDQTTSVPLEGVVFDLYSTSPPQGINPSPAPDFEALYVLGGTALPYDVWLVAEDLTTDADGKFSYNVSNGLYYLHEKQALAGYKLPTSLQSVSVEHGYNGDGLNTLYRLLYIIAGNNTVIESPANMHYFTFTIQNQRGLGLPSTGGMGTKVFMIGGGLLMAGSLLGVFVARRRKENRQTN
jgi:fimbrial isopeptide formation D2 family protein/LPXTG-motif cell wall-anchored protein